MKKIYFSFVSLLFFAILLIGCSNQYSTLQIKGNIEYIEGQYVYLDCSDMYGDKTSNLNCVIELSENTTFIATGESLNLKENANYEEFTIKIRPGGKIGVTLEKAVHFNDETKELKGEALEVKVLN